jgi:hippurate hydrolase
VRTFNEAQQSLMESGMRRICEGIATTHGVRVLIDYQRGYPPTINSLAETELCAEAAAHALGADRVRSDLSPSMGAEDFSYMLRERPGCYAWLGNGEGQGGCMLHSPHYDFNDEIIPLGIAYWVRLVERAMPA